MGTGNERSYMISMQDELKLEQRHSREDSSISQLLGQQQSEQRLAERVKAGHGIGMQNSFTREGILNGKAKHLRNLNKKQIASHSGLETHSRYDDADMLGSKDGKESSFSYLPNISGAYRSKLNSGGQTTDIISSMSRRKYGYNGFQKLMGKNPTLMTNHRKLAVGLSQGGIKVADSMRAQELYFGDDPIHEVSAQKSNTN